MALQLILGNPGAGKSHYLFEKVIRGSMQYPEKQFLVIVPEQFTMQTQKDLVRMHPRHGIMNIDVLSFERLAHRVFGEVGGEHRRILEDTGKNLILRRIAEEKKDELVLLGGNLKKLGYISEVKSLLSEFTQYRMQPEELRRVMEQNKENPQLYFKLKDMLVIYESFREYLEGMYLTVEELLDALEQVVERSETVRGSVIALDGYNGFTPVQMKLLQKLLGLAEEVCVTLTMDGREQPFVREAEYRLFHPTKKTALELARLADRARVEVRKPVILSDAGKYRFREAPALHFMEQHIFRHEKAVWEEETQEVRLFSAGNPRAESEEIGREILRLVRDEGFRYRDIAVVTGDQESYVPLLEQCFSRLGIPGFMDRKRDVLKNSFVEFLRALLLAVQEDFSYESMFRLLRSGMAGTDSEETDRLENYVIARGVRGLSGWCREWKRPLKHMEEGDLETLNEIRARLAGWLETLKEGLTRKDGNVRGMTEALYDCLVGLDIQKKLKEQEAWFDGKGDMATAREYAQIYGMVMDLFDKLVMLLGDCRIPLEEYAELLDAGLSEMKVGLIPAGTDQVLAGDMERSRLKDVKVLFFAGVNEGSVPRDKSRGGILSEMERELLHEQEVELAPTARQEACVQKFYIYLNLTKPSRRLYLSWSQADADGGALRPSFLISQIRQLFPKIRVEDPEKKELLDCLVAPEGNLRELTGALKAEREGLAGGGDRALISWYAARDPWREKLERLMDAVCRTRQEDGIGKTVARALYGTLLEGSVTRLEQFAACAYAHFLQYGLRLEERETCELKAVDMGNVFHEALKYFSDAVEQGGYGWFHVPDDLRDRWMEEALERAIQDHADQILPDRARDQYTLARMKRIGKRTAWAVLRQVERGEFLPEDTEVSFRNLEQLQSVSVLLSEDERMRLQGRIDRIDVCRKDGKVYVRVVDYKSGSTRFDLTSIYYGLQLQLAVYLNAAVELKRRQQDGDGEVHPAGMFYYHIEDPMLDYEEEEDPAKKFLKELALGGLVSAEDGVAELMDREMETGSDILPVRRKKDGGYTAASPVAEEEQFELLMGHVKRRVAEYGERILNGDIRLDPYEMGTDDACRYCAYHSVCGFDRKLEGCEKRRLQPMDREEVWEKMKEEQG